MKGIPNAIWKKNTAGLNGTPLNLEAFRLVGQSILKDCRKWEDTEKAWAIQAH